MQSNYKQCSNGHYYSENLSSCPYCGMREENVLPEDWRYNDDVDYECTEMFPTFCTLGGIYRDASHIAIAEKLHRLREMALWERDVESSEWYGLMHLYIDEYTMKIIERKHCYKYGLHDLDEEVNNTPILHRFWTLKKAIIKKDYGLDWQTPDERFKRIYKEYLLRT